MIGCLNYHRKDAYMAYLLLIMEPRDQRRGRSAEEAQLAYAQMVGFGAGLKARGLLLASDSLRSDAEGTRVTVRDGKRTLLDGPFTEAKEMVGGFFLLDCTTTEQAIAIASECPVGHGRGPRNRSLSPRLSFEPTPGTCALVRI